jgi:hypothetical protein
MIIYEAPIIDEVTPHPVNTSLIFEDISLVSKCNTNNARFLIYIWYNTGRKIRYLTPILHLSVPDMCSMNAEKYTLFIYISGTYRVFLHIVHILYTYRIYMIYV